MSYSAKERRVIDSWADQLDRLKWSIFATFVTPYRTTSRSARRKMEHLQANLCRVHGNETTMFWVAEPFADRYRFHTHALIIINAPAEQRIVGVENAWHEVSRPTGYANTKISQVVNYDSTKGGRFYLAKHLNKENVDYDFFIGQVI